MARPARSSSSSAPSLRDHVGRAAAFSSWESWRAARPSSIVGPAHPARSRRVSSAAIADRGVERALHARSRTAAAPPPRRAARRGSRRLRQAAIRSPTSGWRSDSSQASSSGARRRSRRRARGRPRRPGATSSPQRSTSRVATRSRAEQLVDDGVGGQRRRAEPVEGGQRLRLAGGDPRPVRPTNGGATAPGWCRRRRRVRGPLAVGASPRGVRLWPGRPRRSASSASPAACGPRLRRSRGASAGGRLGRTTSSAPRPAARGRPPRRRRGPGPRLGAARLAPVSSGGIRSRSGRFWCARRA